jgi:sensor histidine kinase YesM
VPGLYFGQSYYDELLMLYTHKRDLLLKGLDDIGIAHNVPQGAYYVMLDISRYGFDSDLEFCEVLARDVGVGAVPGSSFFRYGMAVTMVVQIIGLIYDLRQQYLERLKYERMQKELYEAEVAVMVSQIQPHFMYNALTSIAMMCVNDPKKAQEATVTFAKYLRGNMDSLKQKEPVPFSQELEHLKKYLYIEKLRFGKRLNVEYDIQTEDFKLPQLSVQPLVENAVKHGVGMKKKGGTVTIATRETDEFYEVIISDDGVGFDPARNSDDNDPHIALNNIKERLEMMCKGKLTISPREGGGTSIRITLPNEN